MGLLYSNEVRLRQFQDREAEREQKANELCQKRTTVKTGVDALSKAKQQEYECKKSQILIDRDYSIKL